MSDWMRFARPAIAGIPPYKPGKPIEEVQRELGLTHVTKLASNENPLGPSPRALEAVRAHAHRIHIYPDNVSHDLLGALSRKLGQPEHRIFVGCGSDEIMHLAGLAFLTPEDEVIYAQPTFSVYIITTRLMGATGVAVPLRDYVHDLDAMAEAITPRTKMVFLGNPHNPTGTMVSERVVEAFLDRLPERGILVLDEAYGEYATSPEFPRALRWVSEGRNILILRTFSKAYGLAGLRVGYGIASDHLAHALSLVRLPFTVNLLAQVGAEVALDDEEHLARSRRVNAAGMARLTGAFAELGLRWAPSQANFVLVDLSRDARVCFEALLRRGVIVRPGDALGYPTHLRVSVGTGEENELFLAALREVLEEVEPR